MSAALEKQRIEAIVDAIAERLDGEWLLIGGALVALWLDDRRTTEDVDIIGLRGLPEERYALLQLADDLGLPIESVNSAADFFVRRIDGWRDELRVLKRGSRSTVHRPTTTLFVLLKQRRLSARDLADCLAALAREEEPVDRARLRAALSALTPTEDVDLERRRRELLAALR